MLLSCNSLSETFVIITVNYKMVVSGKTFDAHRQILDQIQASTQQLNLVNMDNNIASGDCQVTFVFCPVVSRVGTDVEAAMKEVQGETKSLSGILF